MNSIHFESPSHAQNALRNEETSISGQSAPSASACAAIASESLLHSEYDTKSAKIMIVDDEPINIKVVQQHLRQAGYCNFVTSNDSREAIDLIRCERPDVVVLDMNMPYVTGLEILRIIRSDRRLHHLPILILTTAGDEATKDQALVLGATDFLTKPLRPIELLARVRNALVVKAHHDHISAYSTQLEREVHQRTAALATSRQELIRVLACASEFRDHETGNHVIRVGRYAGIIAQQLGFDAAEVEMLEQAAILHDVGKIAIPDSVLLKPGKLTGNEMAVMRNHCEFGMNILRCISSDGARILPWSANEHSDQSPILQMAATISISHHEKWDGTGYPLGLSEEMIPIEGRIVAVADVFDALESRRCYKEPMPLDRCFEVIEQGRGTHFDPAVVDAFLARLDGIVAVALELAN